MSSRNIQKKNSNRPKAKDRGLYSGMQRNYSKPKPRIEDNQLKLI